MALWQSLVELAQNPMQEWHRVEEIGDTNPFFPDFEPLDNEIHVLWRYAAWRDYPCDRKIESNEYDHPNRNMSLEFYNRVKPALHLATALLEKAKPIMVRILRSPWVHLKGHGGLNYDPDWIPSRKDYRYLDQQLKQMAPHYRIFYNPPAEYVNSITVGRTHLAQNKSLPRNHPNYVNMTCGIAAEILDEVNGERWLTKSPDQKAGVLVVVAAVLLHELAHAIGMRRIWLDFPANEEKFSDVKYNLREPNLYPCRFGELGETVERYLWGSSIMVPAGLYLTRWDIEAGITEPGLRALTDCSQGLECRFRDKYNRGPERNYTVYAKTIHQLFDRRTWAKDKLMLFYHETNPMLLRGDMIPMYTSVYMKLKAQSIADKQKAKREQTAVSAPRNIIAQPFFSVQTTSRDVSRAMPNMINAKPGTHYDPIRDIHLPRHG